MTGRRQRGVTLIELVTVLLLVGILAVFALPRLNLGGFQQYTFDLELRNALRHAQKVAIGSRCTVQVVIDAGGYSVTYTGAGGDICEAGPLNHPSRSGPLSGSPGGQATILSSVTVTFDGRGATDSLYEIQLGGGRTIRVEEGSGYVREG